MEKTSDRKRDAHLYATSQYVLRDVGADAYRRECLEWLRSVRVLFGVTPTLEVKMVDIIAKSPPIEVWRQLSLLWVDRSGAVENRKILADEICSATVESQHYVFARMMAEYVMHENAPNLHGSRNRWLRDSAGHFAVEFDAARSYPKTMTRSDWWFINRALLLWWIENGHAGMVPPSVYAVA